MMEVSLYIGVSSKRIKPGKACYCYVLEYVSSSGNTYTRSEMSDVWKLPETVWYWRRHYAH